MTDIVLHSKLSELNNELKSEKETRTKLEKEITNLRLDCDDLDAQLNDALDARDRELDISKKLRQDFGELQKKYDHLLHENDDQSSSIKRRNQETIAELNAQVESLTKSKQKLEKDNKQYLLELESLRVEFDASSRSKTQTFNLVKELETKESESQRRIEELVKQLNEASESKSKAVRDLSDLSRKYEHAEFELQQVSLSSKRATQELDDARLQLENEVLFRNSVEIKFRNAQVDLETANVKCEHNEYQLEELHKQVVKLQDDTRQAKDKHDKELEIRRDEAEDAKRRINAKYMEAQEQLTESLLKFNNVDKTKQKLQTQVETLMNELDLVRRKADESARREKLLERELDEAKNKLTMASVDLEGALHTSRSHSNDLVKSKHHNDQLAEQFESALKEKRKLIEEIEAVNNQLNDLQSKYGEMERKYKFSEGDRFELQSQLDDLKDLSSVDLAKFNNLAAQFEKYKSDAEKRSLEKEDELNTQRQSNRRQLDLLQENLNNVEQKFKNEINNSKKKHITESEELKAKVELLKKTRADMDANTKRLQQLNKELSDKLIEEQNLHDATSDQMAIIEKKNAVLRSEMEELKASSDRSDKAKRAMEVELGDLDARLAESQTQLVKALTDKKKYENDYAELCDSIQEVKVEMKAYEDKARSAHATLVKKEEEVRHEKEYIDEIEVARKSLEQQLKEAQMRVEELEDHAKKEIKKASAKFENRCIQIENELDNERLKAQELIKEIRRLEKRNKDLADQAIDEQAKVIALSEAHDKLQDKLKKYRGQIEGAEGQVAANMSKCRRLQRELEDAEERAQSLNRSFIRASSVNRALQSEEFEAEELNAFSDREERETTPTYSRPASFHYSKASAGKADDLMSSSGIFAKASWRSKYTKTIDFDDEDLLLPPTSTTSTKTSNKYLNYFGNS